MAKQTISQPKRIRGRVWLVTDRNGDPFHMGRSEAWVGLQAARLGCAHFPIPAAYARHLAHRGVPFDTNTIASLAREANVSKDFMRRFLHRKLVDARGGKSAHLAVPPTGVAA